MKKLKKRMLEQKIWIENMKIKKDRLTKEVNILKNLKEQLII